VKGIFTEFDSIEGRFEIHAIHIRSIADIPMSVALAYRDLRT